MNRENAHDVRAARCRRRLAVTACVAAALSPAAARAHTVVTLTYETGPTYVAQNDGRYGAGGTAYDADDVGQRDNLVLVSRTGLELERGRHTVILLYAPFQLDTRVTLDDELRFRDTTFPAGAVVDHRYVFEGYRASYLYRVLSGALTWHVGASLQIRNAQVVFTSADGTLHDAETDIGPVPALKTRLRWTPSCGPWFGLDFDGLSTFGLVGDTSGGLYDLGLTVGVAASARVDVYLTARLYGGGAEVPAQEIDNWGNYVSLAAGLRVELGRRPQRSR